MDRIYGQLDKLQARKTAEALQRFPINPALNLVNPVPPVEMPDCFANYGFLT